jgi:alpha,alpha-trehalase
MDLHSLAKRLSRPFSIDTEDASLRLPIDARGMIGDGITAALVRVDGVIDWACFPAFDSASVFAGLLDEQRGGSTAVRPTATRFESLQRYDPDTNVLETLFVVPQQGVVRLVDFMPWGDDPHDAIHEIHRRIEVVEGSVEIEAWFDPRFEYASTTTSIDVSPEGALASGEGGERMVAVISGRPEWTTRSAGGVRAKFRMRGGERRWMVLSWDAPRPEPIAAYRSYEHLRITRRAWREWSRGVRYEGPWRHHVLRSGLVLKLLTHGPSGAMVAAPTTSLPEWLGGVRNWDYRFTWPRDAAMAMRALNLVGRGTEARDFFHFMRRALGMNEKLRPMYAIDGLEVPRERVLTHLRGYASSSPVRIGNGARDQLQLDAAGALVDAAFLYERFDGVLGLRTWRSLRAVVDDLLDRWVQPDEGIWEPRGERRHNVHSKLMCWLAFERASTIAPRFGHFRSAARWSEAAADVRAEVVTRGLSKDGRWFCATYGEERADSALLTLPMHGMLPVEDPRVAATVDRIRSDLGVGPFVYRYLAEDGVGGEEGAFTLCGFWLAEALAMLGRVDEAQEIFIANAEASSHLGLLAEEIDPISREQLGNFPQAFSHLGLINAAVRIDLALRMRDEGDAGVPHPTEHTPGRLG